MYKLLFFFYLYILNIETFISITNIPPVWKTKDGLTVLQTLRSSTTCTVFPLHDNNPRKHEKYQHSMKSKSFFTSHCWNTLFSGLWLSVNRINNICSLPLSVNLKPGWSFRTTFVCPCHTIQRKSSVP